MNTEILRRLSKLYSAVLCDALDRSGYRCQALHHTIRPLYPAARIIGTARTLQSKRSDKFPRKAYQKELEALDAVKPGDVTVFSTGEDFTSGIWGELLSTAAAAKGALGAIVDGLTRDAAKIIEKQFPVFARGISPCDSLGRSEVITYDTPIQCGGVLVNPGDIVFADFDGVVIIPEAIAEVVIEAAEDKASKERIVDDEFRKGRKVAEVFAQHGVL
jgi:4-hydroxy-4-methyl-2-oxoglutarate aldolase